MPFVRANSENLLNFDNDRTLERGVELPWMSEPAASYVYYDCAVGVMLDSGIAVHHRLPQINRTADTLGAVDFDASNLDQITDQGVNLASQDQYSDIVQRMGHSRYWFRLWGIAIRIGYKVPIPRLKTIGGVAAVPYDKNPQWAFNKIAPGGNYGGVILWVAQWSLWYTTAQQPTSNTIPAADPSAHISGTSAPPEQLQAPWSQADDSSSTSAITVTGKPTR